MIFCKAGGFGGTNNEKQERAIFPSFSRRIFPSGETEKTSNIPAFLLAGFAVCLLLYALSFFMRPEHGKPPHFAYAQGYYTSSPKVGITRVIPVARHALMSPATNALNEELIPELELEAGERPPNL